MKKFLIFILFLPLLGCNNIINNKQTYIDFNCPRIFFSADDRFFIESTNNDPSLNNVFLKAELNNFSINKGCQQKDNIAIIPIEILIIVQPIKNIEISEINIPVYITLLDQNDNILETQYFMVSDLIKKDPQTNTFVTTDVIATLEVITQNLKTVQTVIGFMIEDKKREILN
jgi:hypothetical protein